MKKTLVLFVLVLFLSGCATYKFQRGKAPYDKGYVVSRDNYTIPEYTIGRDNSAPDLELAKERLKRRRKIVECYYKQMGYIENQLKMVFWDPAVMFVKLASGVFRLPSIALSDYRYAHNPKYRERIRKLQDEKDTQEEARIKNLKEALNEYIQHDIASEQDKVVRGKTMDTTLSQKASLNETLDRVEQEMNKEKEPSQEELVETKEEQPHMRIEQKPKIHIEEKVGSWRTQRTELPRQPEAVIIAKPTKGLSPLRVHFYGYKSYAPKGKIVSYIWDFGDGETSTEKNPINTYWSTNYGSTYFTATLTIEDDKGNTATASTIIEVMTK